MLNYLSVLFCSLCLFTQFGCAGVMYRISSYDSQLSTDLNSYSEAVTCRPASVRLKWDSAFSVMESASYRYTGEKVDYVIVDRVKLIEGAARAIEKSTIPVCADAPEAIITVLGVTHSHGMTSDVGVDYISAQIRLMAKIECTQREVSNYELYFGRSPESKLGFLDSSIDIQKGLIKTSSEAALSALFKVLKQCE